jgi:hypothetical protein
MHFATLRKLLCWSSYLGVLQTKQSQECTPEKEPRTTMQQKIVTRTYYPASVTVPCTTHFHHYNNHVIVIDDLTRVYLKSTGARGSDYINANYIDVRYDSSVIIMSLMSVPPPSNDNIGIQTQESIHCNTRTNGVNCQWLLADGVGAQE